MATTEITSRPSAGPTAGDFSVDVEQVDAREAVRRYLERLRGGELGSLPALAGFVVLFGVFSITAGSFLTSRNFANLLTQATPVILIGVGVSFVLLLGEIDLSAGATAGVCAVSMALLFNHGWSEIFAIPAAVVIGMVIGLLTGFLVARVGIPSFVVTLAFFLSWQGVVLQLAKETGEIAVKDTLIVAIANKNLKPWQGWLLFVLVVGGYLLGALFRIGRRHAKGLATEPVGLVVLKGAALAVVWGIATYFLNRNRGIGAHPLTGVPIAVPFVLVIVLILSFVMTRTPWGRHLYAVGGNAEASRRAGINVARVRMSGFIMCSSVAAVGGMALASRLQSVSPQTGGNDTVLLAVAAAVIGGTSLFGGRGKISNAVLGGLVVAIIPNGMGLLGKKGPFDFSSSGPKFIATGLVLLLAASVDALSRKRSSSGGGR